MPWPKTVATQYHAQLGLPDKGHAIKGLVVSNGWDLDPLNLLNSLALGFLRYDFYVNSSFSTITRTQNRVECQEFLMTSFYGKR